MNNPVIGLIQSNVTDNKEENIDNARALLEKAAASGAALAVLPEIFNSPYSSKKFPEYAEPEGGTTWQMLSSAARELGLFIVGGSIPERDDDGRIYNTCFIFDADGKPIGKHRKIHLFDIDIEGGQRFRESETLSPGSSVTVFDTPWGKMGAAICYDIRFSELFRIMALEGAKVIFVPGAFNMTTGPAHWELTFRTRALDNQVYTVGAAPARNEKGSYVSYANSIICSPWGDIVGRLGTEQEILIRELDMDKVEKLRRQLPLLAHRRTDVYNLTHR
jgi:omega-amidase